MRNELEKTSFYSDLKETAFNAMGLWIAGKAANVIANSFFHYDLNKCNSIDHLVIGVGLGTLAYKKAGGGLRGVATGLIAATLFNAG
jgi:hypothetical protein